MKQDTQNGMKLVNVNQISSACDNKQCWNNAKCRCECKELIDKGIYEFECDKSCDVREYLDYENCTCRKRLIDKLVEECSESIDENEMIHNDYKNVCHFCTVYICCIFCHCFVNNH